MDDRLAAYAGKSVMITGVCGTVGAELLRQVSRLTNGRIVGIDNNETEVAFLQDEYTSDANVEIHICDLRDRDGITRRMREIDIVIHAAALKHVGVCERSPDDAIQTNISGVQNIVHAAFSSGVQRVLFTSSDKAVNPTNVMGTSKLMGERLVTAANAQRRSGSDPIFATTRFGNVLGSRGSVIPIFKRQIKAGGPVTLTDRRMTRFIMSLPEAVELVLQSVHLAFGGEVFVTKMPVVRIEDLAQAMIQELSPAYGFVSESIHVEEIGSRPGEKMFEELVNDEESRRIFSLDQFFVVTPAISDVYSDSEYPYKIGDCESAIGDFSYNSLNQATMSIDTIQAYLRDNVLNPTSDSLQIDAAKKHAFG